MSSLTFRNYFFNAIAFIWILGLEVDLMEVWDHEGKVVIFSLSWKKLQVPNNKGVQNAHIT
jgi:hypothetical protein